MVPGFGPAKDFAKFDRKFVGALSAPKLLQNVRSDARFGLIFQCFVGSYTLLSAIDSHEKRWNHERRSKNGVKRIWYRNAPHSIAHPIGMFLFMLLGYQNVQRFVVQTHGDNIKISAKSAVSAQNVRIEICGGKKRNP